MFETTMGDGLLLSRGSPSETRTRTTSRAKAEIPKACFSESARDPGPSQLRKGPGSLATSC